jgi:hypothetical protein
MHDSVFRKPHNYSILRPLWLAQSLPYIYPGEPSPSPTQRQRQAARERREFGHDRPGWPEAPRADFGPPSSFGKPLQALPAVTFLPGFVESPIVVDPAERGNGHAPCSTVGQFVQLLFVDPGRLICANQSRAIP